MQDDARQPPGLCPTSGPPARPRSSEEAGERPVALQGLEGDAWPSSSTCCAGNRGEELGSSDK